MFMTTSHHRFVSFFLLLLFLNFFLGTTKILAQQQNKTNNQEKKKSKIIFNKQLSDSTKIDTSADTSKSKITFGKSYFLKKDEIKLISSKEFEMYGETKMVGEKGELLIRAMGNNQHAIEMINLSYKTKKTGKVLMGLGVVISLVTLFTLPYVELGGTESGGYKTTYYWFPFITIGAVVGGIGYAKYNSLEKNIDKAIKVYNADLIMQKPDADSK